LPGLTRSELEAWIRDRIHDRLLRARARAGTSVAGELQVLRPPELLRQAVEILAAIAAAERERDRLREEREAVALEFGMESDPFRFYGRKLRTQTMRRLRALRRAMTWLEELEGGSGCGGR